MGPSAAVVDEIERGEEDQSLNLEVAKLVQESGEGNKHDPSKQEDRVVQDVPGVPSIELHVSVEQRYSFLHLF